MSRPDPLARPAVSVTLASEVDFAGFRTAARRLAMAGTPPEAVVWRVPDGADDLFAAPASADAGPVPAGARPPTVPRAFVALAEAVACHRSPDRFALLYRLLWRLQSEPKLLEVASDPDVRAARLMEKSVRRDEHKMHAFVRFREVETADGPRFVAWFEPEHFIEERTAGFFERRFAAMLWTIVTPRRTIAWDGETLALGPGGRREDVPAEDAEEALWLTYYSHIFNPARLKTKAMVAEMPKKYWRNLPEARLIPELVAGAEARVRGMIAAGPTEAPVRAERLRRAAAEAESGPAIPAEALDALRREAAACTRCPLHATATQTVFGEGPADARVVFVGEQPGDREDLAGRPFVGPAGQLLDAVLGEVGIDRAGLYLTNAVKHFKFEPRGKRRIHQKPNAGEVSACRWWVAKELEAIDPALVVALGGTAAEALLGEPVKITGLRGRFMPLEGGRTLFATYHPSAVLRVPDPAAQAKLRATFAADLAAVRDWMRQAA